MNIKPSFIGWFVSGNRVILINADDESAAWQILADEFNALSGETRSVEEFKAVFTLLKMPNLNSSGIVANIVALSIKINEMPIKTINIPFKTS